MLSQDIELQGLSATTMIPDWLRGLLLAVRRGSLQPKDPRVKSLWGLLMQRGLLRRSPWLQARLRYMWNKGLSIGKRPRTAQRMMRLLRSWGILPPRVGRLGARGPVPITRLSPIAAQPLRPVAARPVLPVTATRAAVPSVKSAAVRR